jgi:hypothetical protein
MLKARKKMEIGHELSQNQFAAKETPVDSKNRMPYAFIEHAGTKKKHLNFLSWYANWLYILTLGTALATMAEEMRQNATCGDMPHS